MKERRASKELLVACLLTVSIHFGVGNIQCKYDEFVVQDIIGNLSCIPCPKCPKGMGLSPQCGSYVSYGTVIECKPCIDGISYSSKDSIESCQPCGICADHQKVLEKCHKTHNSRCGKSCEKGFYLSSVVGDCQECSWCCPDSDPQEHENQCKKSGVPFYKQCKIDESIRCQPRCTDQQFIIVSESLNKTCLDCPHCGIGQGLFPHCPSVLSSTKKPTCVDCIPGKTFSNSKDSSSCKPCTVCEVGKKRERVCNSTHDTLCGDCSHGFYKDKNELNKETCKECSFCCGDKEDVIIPECMAQGLPKEKQCSYTTRSVTQCRPNDKLRTWLIILLCILLIVILIVVLIAMWCIKKRRKYQPLIEEGSEEENHLEETPYYRMGKEYPSPASRATNIEFRQSGIIVQCRDVKVGEDLLKSMSVEICWDGHRYLPVRDGEIYLSPLIKLHPHGYSPGKPLKLDIPHSAFKQDLNSTWSIKVFTQTLSSKAETPIELNELIDQEMEINPCSVKFSVTELAAYVVVGIPGDPKLAKKRMQCAVFGAEPKIGQLYSLNLYLFDDGESSLQKLREDEERQGHHLLQKLFRSLYPDMDNESVIGVTIDKVKEGWSGELSQQVIESYEWIDSYRKIPMIEAKFKHTNPQIRDFSCTFKLKFNDKTVEIPVFHYSEPEIVSNGIQPCDENTPNDIHIGIAEEDRSSLTSLRPLSTLPNEVITKLCQSIDQTIDNQRIESVALKIIPSIKATEISLIKSSNRPFTTLLKVIKDNNPSLPAANLYFALQTEGFDSTACQELLPYMYEVTPHV